MKKILFMLTVLGTVHFGAMAQVGTGGYNGNKMDQGNLGQKIDVIESRKGNANTNNTMPAATHTTTYHHTTTTHHTYTYHKAAAHHTVHHSYARTGAHKGTHRVAMHHKTMHRTTHAVVMHRTVKHGYSGNRMRMHTTRSMNTSSTSTTVKPYIDPATHQNANVNRKIPDTPYPGSSDGGWGDGTNGKAGTNSEDGTIRTDGR